MKQKLFTLFALLLCLCSGAWATDIFSLSVKSGASLSVNHGSSQLLNTTDHLSSLSGGTVTCKNKRSGSGSQVFISTDNSETHLSFTHNDCVIIVELSQNLANGDVITFTGSSNNVICFTASESRSTTYKTTNKSYTIAEADGLAGKSTLYIWRNSGNTYIKTLTISRTATTTYSVNHNLTNVTATSGATGTSAATAGTAYNAVFAASSGYTLPETISVTIGGTTATAGTDYTWNSSTGAFQVPATKVTGAIVVTIAGVAENSAYTVSFDAGTHGTYTGGDITEASAGAGITLPGLTTLATGYTFNGWYTAASGGTKAGDAGATYKPSIDTELFAQYSAKTYSITLHDNNGGTNNGSATATYDSKTLTSVTAPTYSGHSIAGYYQEAACTNLIADASGNLQANTDYTDASGNWTNDGNVTLYAKWQENVYYTVTLNPNGGTIGDATGWTLDNGQYKKTSIAGGTELELPTFTKTDRTFLTWRDDSDNEYTSPITVNSNLTITAIWGKEKETIIYSWESPSGTAVETGGTATHYNNNTAVDGNTRVNYANTANGTTYYTISLSGKNDYSTDHIRIALNENIKTGDEVRITAYYTKESSANAAAKMNTQDGTVIFTGSNLPNIYSGGSPVLQTYTVPANINTNAIKMTRHQTGSTSFITKLQIVRTETIEEQDPCEAPTITSQPAGADYDWDDAISPLTVTASVADGGTLSYQWYKKGSPDVEVGTNSASYTPAEAGTYYVVVTNSKEGYEDASTTSSDAVITITDSRKSVTLSFSATAINDYNFDGETLTAPTLTAVDGDNNPIDLAELPELTFSKTGNVVTVNETTGAITAANINNFGSSTVTVSFAGNDDYKATEDKSYTVTRAPYLRQVLFDNGFDAFIKEGSKTVNVYYMAGTDAPAQTGDIQVADGFTAEVVGNNVVLTQTATNKTKTYAISKTAVTPFVGAGKQTFDGTETYVASGYGWDENSNKKWKFSKTDTDWTREAPGNTRLYFFVGAGTSAAFSFATSRAVKIKVNGTDAGTDASSITLNANQPNMIEFQSNQTGGDGGFKDMTITDPKQVVTISANKYATFSSTQKLDFTNTGVTAYKATTNTNSSVHLEEVTVVPANTGVLLYADVAENTVFTIPVSTEDASNMEGNKLQSTANGAHDVTAEEYEKAYVFGMLDNEVGFYKAAVGKTVKQGRCYLLLDAAIPQEAPFLSIIFDDGATTNINLNDNDNLNFDQNAPRYNLAGQKVNDSYKGIVIVNGKKVVIK